MSLDEHIRSIVAEEISRHGLMAQPRLLDVPAAATYLGRTEKAVRMLVETGKVRVVRLDGKIQFDRRDLDECIELSKSK